MSVLEKAKELGDQLAVSEELNEMKNSQLAVMQNPEAKAIVDEFQEKQQEYFRIQQQGQELNDSQKNNIKELEQKMSDNPLIAEYINKQQKFEKLLEEINNIISQSISGEQQSCDDSCCSSCNSGC
ncbi:MAG: YlbF family regulator [Firmicutes bacterium]|nr:YlbF family regulator [Bacillota bacterium]